MADGNRRDLAGLATRRSDTLRGSLPRPQSQPTGTDADEAEGAAAAEQPAQPPENEDTAARGAASGTSRTGGPRRSRQSRSSPRGAERSSSPADPGPASEGGQRARTRTQSSKRGRGGGSASRPASSPAHRDADEQLKQRPRPIVVYMSPGLLERLRARSAATGQSYTLIALDAIAAHHEHLGDIFADLAPAPTRNKLFPPRRNGPQAGAGPRVQVGLRPTEAELEIIDGLVRDHDLPSRTELVVRLLERELGDTG